MAYTFLDAQNKLSSLLGDSNTGTNNMYPLADRKAELNNAELDFAERGKDNTSHGFRSPFWLCIS